VRLSHHPSEATLLAYAAGSLDEGASVVVAVHLGACPDCLEAVRVCESVGGQMLAAMQGADMAPDALTQALARLDTKLPPPTPAVAPPIAGLAVPHALTPYRLGNWRWVAPGIRHIPVLPRRAGRSGLYLLRIAPGTALPGHGHDGNELACILTGSYTDETGRFREGDLAEMDTDDEHKPVADGGGCTCLIATDAPLRFRGLLPRLLQPVLGF
jgi:putative transcriptional regulator